MSYKKLIKIYTKDLQTCIKEGRLEDAEYVANWIADLVSEYKEGV